MSKHTIAVLGIGNMGAGISKNLARFIKQNPTFHPELLVYNRSPEKAQRFAQSIANNDEYAKVSVSSPEYIAKNANVIFSCLFDDHALEIASKASSPKNGLLFVNTSTVYPAVITTINQQASSAGIRFVNSPVFGRPDAAHAGKLVSTMAGSSEAKEEVKPILEAYSRAVIDVGEDPKLSAVLKIIGNFTIASTIEVSAEAQFLAEMNSLSSSAISDLYSHLFPGIFAGYSAKIHKSLFSAEDGFSIDGGLKDVGFARQLANESGSSLPLGNLIYDHLQTAKELEAESGEKWDWSSLAKSVQKESGL
ncbi:hypothetical protein HK096_011041 [Nowakowskiella sp. JEL0078]|nr:hypothetical protein HK096_011041 [Nowakowskiella sp. JEL0078]